jgi:OFA family oxalate/formate antiporter-like MFS transporter
MNRWLVAVGALLIQLCLGAIYAWSVFTPGLAAKTANQVVTVYTVPTRTEQVPDPAAPGETKEKVYYAAPFLGVEETPFMAMLEDLKAPRAELKAIEKKLDEAKEAAIDGLQKQKAAINAEIETTVTTTVAKEKIEALKYGFTEPQLQWIFAVGLAAFAVVMVLAGRMMPVVGPMKLAIAGGVVLGAGYVLAGLVGGTSFPLHLLCIGVIGGAGIGLAYVVPIAVGMRWFPDKKGLITGLAVAGFGFGALGWVKLAGSFGRLIATMGLPAVFTIYGVAFFALVVIGSIWMRFPAEGWKPAGWTPPEAKTATPAAGTVDFTSSEMLATPQFYMIFLIFIFSAGAGLMTIGLMKRFPPQALIANDIDPVLASDIAGTAMAVFFSLANGIGRIAWGTMSDFLGRKLSILVMCATQGVFVLLFTVMAGTPYLLYLGATVIGFNFGGNFALFPTITADTFGAKFVGQNYPWVFLAYGVGGIFGPMLGGILGGMNNFPLAFTICGVLCLVAAVVAALIRPAQKAA